MKTITERRDSCSIKEYRVESKGCEDKLLDHLDQSNGTLRTNSSFLRRNLFKSFDFVKIF